MSILYLIQAFPYWCKCWWSSFFPLSTHFCYYKQCCNNYPCTHISNTSLRANICPLLFMSEELGEFSQISGLGFSGVRKICFPYRRLIVDSILAERYLIRLTRLRFIVREHWAKFSGIHFFFFRLCCGYLVLAQLNSVYLSDLISILRTFSSPDRFSIFFRGQYLRFDHSASHSVCTVWGRSEIRLILCYQCPVITS